jgi:hypothetical protein
MSLSASTMSRNHSSIGTWLRTFFARLYVAIDQSQRKRAEVLIQHYGYLLADPASNLEDKPRAAKDVASASQGDRAPPSSKKAWSP